MLLSCITVDSWVENILSIWTCWQTPSRHHQNTKNANPRFSTFSQATPLTRLTTQEADRYLDIGRWRNREPGLLLAFGVDPGTMGDVAARLTAAYQGRTDEARAHHLRAEEFNVHKSEFINLNFDAIRAVLCLATGDPESHYTAAMIDATSTRFAPTMYEWLIPLAARALANQIRRAKDARVPTTALDTLTDYLVQQFPVILRDFGEETDASHTATLLWEEASCCWRAADALLLHGHTQGELAKFFLRRGLTLSEELRAEPLRTQLDKLPTRARIQVVRPVPGDSRQSYGELLGLTPRGRELLDYVVAGRSYAELARGLFSSEKSRQLTHPEPAAQDRCRQPS